MLRWNVLAGTVVALARAALGKNDAARMVIAATLTSRAMAVVELVAERLPCTVLGSSAWKTGSFRKLFGVNPTPSPHSFAPSPTTDFLK